MARVLIVDDDNDHRSSVGDYFQAKGHDVTLASDGRMALAILMHKAFDLVILDLNMPVLGGLETMEEIRKKEYKCHIIILTGMSYAEKYFYYKNGCILFERKPVDLIELEYKVRNLFITTEKPDPLTVPENSHLEKDMIRIYQFLLKQIGNHNLNAEFICSNFGLNKNQLYNRINELLTITLHDLIKNLRLLKARELLDNGKLTTISELSNEVGYSDSGYFTRLFNEAFGCDLRMIMKEKRKRLPI